MSTSKTRTGFVYLNGEILPRAQATMDIEDRGTLFADGVYEVVKCFNGRARAIDRHVKRLSNSLAAIGIPETGHVSGLTDATFKLLALNNTPNAKAYWQVTRGVAPRDHLYGSDIKPTVLAIIYPASPFSAAASPEAIGCILHPDERWGRCDIKSLMLLPNVIARNKAEAVGCKEAILHKDGHVTECTSSSLFVVRSGRLITHPADHRVLPGVTRSLLLEVAQQRGITVQERPFNTNELLTSDEVFVSVTTANIKSVVSIDGRPVANGKIGSMTSDLFDALNQIDRRDCGLS